MMEGGDATIDGAKAHIARVYDALLGANDNYQPDRALAFRLRTEWPIVEKIALENRYFLIRAVRHLAQAGLDQFIDIGSGLPTVESVHEVAQATNPDARVAYVDNDPLVLAHARALLATDDNTRIIGGDMRQPEQLLEAVATQHRRIDLDRPVVFLFVSVLHFLDDPHPLLRACQRAMAPGSHMVISHGLADPRIADAAR
jgi:SAM-dependent methyltransferase